MKSPLRIDDIAIALVACALLVASVPGRAAVVFHTDTASFDAASDTALVEDFEAFAPKNTPLSSFVSNGNTYTGLAGSPFPNVFVSAPGFTNYGLPGPTTSSILTANGDEDIRIDLGSPSTAVGFDTYLNEFGPATVRVFGSGGLLDTFVHVHDPTTIGFLGITSSEPVTSVRWTTVDGGIINTGVDNIRLGRAVPEPWTGALAILGLLGLGLRRRR